jgi:GNAT superfamily N-acetyltransferase
MVRRQTGEPHNVISKTAGRRPKRSRIAIAKTPAEIRRCHAVMRELRPKFTSAKMFVRRVQRQQGQGYVLAYLEAEGKIRAVAGYRYLESLFSGKFIYVDDLVTLPRDRSRGFGGQLLDWLVEQARVHDCEQLELDSGVQRFDAHRFYLLNRMKIASYHFSIEVAATKKAKA